MQRLSHAAGANVVLLVPVLCISMSSLGKPGFPVPISSLKEGDIITLNGTTGYAYLGSLPMMDASENPRFKRFMTMADKFRTMGVRTNADTPEDAQVARKFGAEGMAFSAPSIMFYGAGADKPCSSYAR